MEQALMKIWQSIPPLEALTQNGTFWVSISFIGLVGLLIYFGFPKMIAQGLDAQREVIAKELEEAENLYTKAQALLNEHQEKHNQHTRESATLMATAKKQVADYQAEQEQNLTEKLTRLEAQAHQRIELAKKQAVNALHKQALDLAMTAAQKIIAQRGNHDQLIEQSINEIEVTLNKAEREQH